MAGVRGMASMQPWCGSKYAIGPELGRGGMATVHFGLVMGDLGFARTIAIKRIHPELANDQVMVGRLRDEARVAARIRHPNVVSVLDIVAVGNEVGIVLDYVHGESLAELLQRADARSAPLPVDVSISIAIDVLHGLHAAHTAKDEQGELLHVVHRDVSPQNILVGVDGVARVLDFGIAKAENRSQVTRDGAVKGKLGYMAPEQLGGDVSERSDLYAVGVVLWELLVGHSPFAHAATDSELLGLVLLGVSTPPSRERPEVPTAIDAIVLRALAPDARDRYANASAMAQALELAGAGGTRTAVASVVADLAADTIAARTAIVAAIEAGSGSVVASDTLQNAAPTMTMDRVVAPVAAVTSGGRTRSAYTLALILGVLLLATASFFVVRARRRADDPAAASVAPNTSAAAATLPSSAPSVSTAPPIASAPPAASATPQSSSTHVQAQRKGMGPDCTVPYTVGPGGQRRYRRECFAK